MASDWKESSLKKRDFQHSKSDPEIPKHKKKSKGKYTHKLIAKKFKWGQRPDEDWIIGKYKNKTGAEQALKQMSSSWIVKFCEQLLIEEIV